MALSIFNVAFIIFLSLLPISELRGAILYGLSVSGNVIIVFLTSVISNILVIPITFFFLDFIHKHLLPSRLYKNLFDRFVNRTRQKSERYIARYGWLGLGLFVAVPLPITGAYTGTLAAWFLGVERKKAVLALSAGVVLAGIIVTIAYFIGVNLGTFIGSRILGLLN